MIAIPISRHRFTTEDWHGMAAAGLFAPDVRVELVEGEVVDMVPIGARHNGCVNWLANRLTEAALGRLIVQVQGPIRLGDFSEPIPDVALLRHRPDYYRTAHPGPEDCLLVIEVAETSLRYDREVKLPLYARFGIPEAWLVDLQGGMLTRYARPSLQGYGESSGFGVEETIPVGCLGDETLGVAAIIGVTGAG